MLASSWMFPVRQEPGIVRHDLGQIAPWLQDANHIRQAGVLPEGHSPYEDDPFDNLVYGTVERNGGYFIFNTGTPDVQRGRHALPALLQAGV